VNHRKNLIVATLRSAEGVLSKTRRGGGIMSAESRKAASHLPTALVDPKRLKFGHYFLPAWIHLVINI
jgi:hypothetical protein